MMELYTFSLTFSLLPFFFPSSLHLPLRSDPLNPARRSVDMTTRGLKRGYTKTGLTGDLSRAPYALVWRGICGGLSLPPEKNEFGIGGGAISACIEGSVLTCILLSVLISWSIFYHVLNASPPHPAVFLCKFRQIAKPI